MTNKITARAGHFCLRRTFTVADGATLIPDAVLPIDSTLEKAQQKMNSRSILSRSQANLPFIQNKPGITSWKKEKVHKISCRSPVSLLSFCVNLTIMLLGFMVSTNWTMHSFWKLGKNNLVHLLKKERKKEKSYHSVQCLAGDKFRLKINRIQREITLSCKVCSLAHGSHFVDQSSSDFDSWTWPWTTAKIVSAFSTSSSSVSGGL